METSADRPRLEGGVTRMLVAFCGRHLFAAAILLGLLLAAFTLSNGLVLDDYQQRIALLTGEQANVFEFFHRGTRIAEAQMERGVLPWWTHPETKVVFLRPLAQWLMQLDYRLWPDNVTAMHLHSILWYGIAILVACLAYRRIMPSRFGAGLAAVLFAVDPSHAAVGWLANRNIMPCLSSALLSLLCFSRDSWRWQIAGCCLFAISLGCGEAGLAITGYYLAYALFLCEERWRQRVLRLLPYALIALIWLAFWKDHGYGTSGPGFYIDPATDPAGFVKELFYRFPAYLVAQLFLPPAEVFAAFNDSGARAYLVVYALCVAALFTWLLRPSLRSSREARFFALGMLISIVPICGSIPVQRSLWFVGFGASGLLALFIEQFRSLSMSGSQQRHRIAFARAMLIIHLGMAPLLFLVYAKTNDVLDGLMDSRRVQLPDQGVPQVQVLALSALNYVTNITFPIFKDEALSLGSAPTRTAPAIRRIRALSEGQGEYTLLRRDADTLIATSAIGFNSLRPPPYGFAAGDHVRLDDVDVVVRSISGTGAPTAIEYDFKPGVLWSYEIIAWHQDHFVPASLPAIGERMSIKTQAPCMWCSK